MRELQAQSLVVKAVREHGGVAFKMANRFLVGVSDLFVQLPGCYTYLWEAKLLKTKFDLDETYDVTVTPKQRNFICDVMKAGGHAGTMSFIQDRHDLYFAVVDGASMCIHAVAYVKLERGNRENRIVECLYAMSHYNWRDM